MKNRKDVGEKIGLFVNFMNRRIEMELTFSFQTYKSVKTNLNVLVPLNRMKEVRIFFSWL